MKRLAVVLLVLLLACPALGVLGLKAAAAYQQSHALALQAQATLAQATATQTLAFTQLVLLVLGGGVVFFMALVAVGLGVILWMNHRAKPKWAPGPNAGWRRASEEMQSRLPDINTLMTLVLMERLFPGPQATLPLAHYPALSRPAEDEEEDEGEEAWPWF